MAKDAREQRNQEVTDLPGTPQPLGGLVQGQPEPEEARVDVAPTGDPQATQLTIPGIPEVEEGEGLTAPEPETGLPPVEFMQSDRSNAYMEHRENFSGANELDQVLSRVRSREGQATAVTQEKGVQTQDDTRPPQEEGQEQQIVIGRILGQEGFGAFVNGEMVGAGATEEEALAAGKEAIAPPSFGEQAAAVGKDIVRGLTELPLQVVGGAADAIQETVNAVDSLGDWLNENVADLRVEVDIPFVDDDEVINLDPGDVAEAILPDVAEAESVTGGGARAISQFITGFVGAGKLLKGMGLAAKGGTAAQVGEAMAKGAIADFTVFDPHEDRLSNMIQQVPELQNPVTEYLAADEDDTETEGRLKNAIEGLGLGAIVDGMMLSVKTLRGARKARALQEEAVENLQRSELIEQEVEFGRVDVDEFADLGDPNVDDIVLRRPAAGIEGKLADAPEGVRPQDILGGEVDLKATDVGETISAAKIDIEESAARGADLEFDDVFEDVSGVEVMSSNIDESLITDDLISISDLPEDSLASLRESLPEGVSTEDLVPEVFVKKAPTGGWIIRPELKSLDFKQLNQAKIDEIVGKVNTLEDALKSENHAVRFYAFKQALDDRGVPYREVDKGLASRYLYLGEGDAIKVRFADHDNISKLHTPPTHNLSDSKAGQTVDVLNDVLRSVGGPGDGVQEDAFINFARIDTPEDVQRAIKAMADINKEGIDKARRGVQTNIETELAAEKVNAWEVLTNRREGQPLNAEESLALRQLWSQSGDALTQAARKAADNPGEANLFAFRKMVAVHDAIQKEVIAARTETARALQSWRIPAGGGIEQARAIQDILATKAETPEVHRELARRISVLAESGEFEALDEVVKRSVGARTYDAVVQAWINGLLSGPKTHLVNMMSNTSVIFNSMAERAVAARLGHVMGTDNAVQMGEATAQWFGLVQGLKDSFRISAKGSQVGPAMRRIGAAEGIRGRVSAVGEAVGQIFPFEEQGTVIRSAISGQSGFGLNKIDVPRQGAMASEVWDVASDTFLGRTLDTLNVVTQIPGRALGAEDELFKTIGYRMELNAQALRQAQREVSAGMIPEAELKGRIAEIIENPPENIRLSAIDAAAYQTFNGAPGKISQTIMKYREAAPVIGVLTAPFVRTVGNLLKYTYERTPLAPLMGEVRANIAAGGARRDMALARISTGSTMMLISADMAMSGQITGQGPSDPQQRAAMRRAGIKPYSVKVGDRWFAYNRLDPIGTLMGLSADVVDITVNGDFDDDKWNEDVERAVIATIAAIGNNSMNESYMQGMANFVEAMADPSRNAEYWAGSVAGSIIPTGVAEIARYQDPYMREARSMWDSIRARTPGMSDELPLRRDLWGRPIDRRSGLGATFDAVSPIYSKKENPEPIDTELLRLGDAPSSMPRRTSLSGVTVNLDQYEGAYSRLVELAGNEVKLAKYGNKGAKDALNDIIQGKSPFSTIYKLRTDGPDGGKMSFIRGVVQEYRAAAKDELLDEFPQILVEIRRKKKAQTKWQIQQTQ